MTALNTPIISDDKGLKKVLGRKQPALLYLYDGTQTDKPLDDALKREAKRNADELLVVKVDVSKNPNTHSKYGKPTIPAIVALSPAFFGRKIKATAEGVRPADVRAHVGFLLRDEPLSEARSTEKSSGKSNGKLSKKGARHVNNTTWRKEVLKSKTPVLVDFWAAWCGPCNVIAPFIDDLADKYAGKVKVVKLNTEESHKIAGQFSIQSIPTFIMFDGGQPVERISGASPRAIENMVQEALLPE